MGLVEHVVVSPGDQLHLDAPACQPSPNIVACTGVVGRCGCLKERDSSRIGLRCVVYPREPVDIIRPPEESRDGPAAGGQKSVNHSQTFSHQLVFRIAESLRADHSAQMVSYRRASATSGALRQRRGLGIGARPHLQGIKHPQHPYQIGASMQLLSHFESQQAPKREPKKVIWPVGAQSLDCLDVI